MFTKDFIEEELTIFELMKKYFEKFPPIDSDDYENAFYELVARYGREGEVYLIKEPMLSELIELQIGKTYLQLSESEKEEIKKLYEKYFIDKDYFDEITGSYLYDTETLAIYISVRFKRWILDVFNQVNSDGDVGNVDE